MNITRGSSGIAPLLDPGVRTPRARVECVGPAR
jgi:hypothetical protein